MITQSIKPLPGTLMGIDNHRIWDRFAIRTTVTAYTVTVEVIELISLTQTRLLSTETLTVPR